MELTRLSGFLAAAALCGAALESSAQLTVPYANTFDTAGSVAGWDYWMGVIPGSPAMAWDSTEDAANNPASGSLKVSIPWNGTSSVEYWFGGFQLYAANINMIGAYITNVSCDIHVDPSSPTSSAGNFGSVTFAYNGAESWSGSTVTLPLSASNGWRHVSVPIPSNAAPGVHSGFSMWMNTPSGAPLNSTTLFWIDNLKTGATPNYTNGFNEAPGEYGLDAASSSTSWVYGQGMLAPAIYGQNSAVAWSSSMDANGNSASGSLQVSIPWTGTKGNATGANLSQTMFGTFANRYVMDNGQTTSGFNFQNLYYSVHVDPSSPLNAAGNYGVLQIGFLQESDSPYGSLWNTFTWPAASVTLNANASVGWTNIVVPIDYLTPGLSSISGLSLEMQTGAAQGGGLPGTTLLYVDNLGMNAAFGPTLPEITSVSELSTNVVINGINPNGDATYWYVILSSPSLSLPPEQWTPVATNSCHANGTFSYTNFINPSQPAMYYTFYLTNIDIFAPGASFTMSTNMGVAPFTVNFTDTSTKNPTSWFWTFGDGGTSTQQNPSYTFTNIWRQTVTLTASNASGGNSCSQPLFQCFPCDALYDWTGGIQGNVITIPTLSNSLAPGANTIGHFSLSNVDLPSSNVLGIIFTNLPGMTNGCPVVFSNGVIDANFNITNALAFSWTNNHEEYMFLLNSGVVVTNIVLLYYGSMPLVITNAGANQYADELGISTTVDNPVMGSFILNRNMAQAGPLPGYINNNYACEAFTPAVSGYCPPGFFPTNAWFNGNVIYEVPNKLYRILMEENTNGDCVMAVGDPVASICMGFVTNHNTYTPGHPFSAYSHGHISGENFHDKTTSILAYHNIISINRPLTWQQVTNVVAFGP